MDDTLSLDFIGRRLDSVQVDTADVRRRMIRLEEKMDAHHAATDIRMSSIERGQFIMEQRMSAMVERQSKMEELLHRALLILETWQQRA